MVKIQMLTYLILALPLAGGLITGGFVRSHRLAHYCCTTAVAGSFVASLLLLQAYLSQPALAVSMPGYGWLTLASLQWSMGFYLDGLSLPMVMMVTGVSTLIHVYSIGYMHEEAGYVRFFSCISLFTFAMLWLVLTDNLVGLFFGWEGVSLLSYFLIGYYYFKDSAADASVKAFVINRFGDCALCLGVMLLICHASSAQYVDVISQFDAISTEVLLLGGYAVPILPLSATLLFIGAMSKSAQMPLHIWLPDSMEGPTPVSALIHAATMVTAGVYLMCRFGAILAYAQTLCWVIAFLASSGICWLGILAVSELDIKRIAAYSTLSQLGYMMLAVALGAYQLAIFHLVVHAFFKACLFMSVGSVIHSTRHEQNIHELGGLWRLMPVTAGCYLIAACALSGIAPFSGFYSKDLIVEVLAAVPLTGVVSYYVFATTFAGFLITPLYTFRLFWLVFVREREQEYTFVYESPPVMLVPMVILAGLSLVAGACLWPVFIENTRFNFSHLATSFPHVEVVAAQIQHIVSEGIYSHALWNPGTYTVLLGVALSWVFFRQGVFNRNAPGAGKLINGILRSGYGFEALRLHVIQPTVTALAAFLAWNVDQWSINDSVEYYLGGWVSRQSEKLSRLQPSLLTWYLAFIWLGVVMMLLVLLMQGLLRGGVVA